MTEKKPIPQVFNIEHQFDRYLDRVKIDKRKAPAYQIREMRRSFFGAWGMLLMLQQDELSKITSDDEAVNILQDMLNQVSDFFLKETGRQN